MTSSSSDGSRKRPREESVEEDEASRTKRAASTEKALNELNEPIGLAASAGSEDPIDTYMRQQESPAPMQAPNKPIPPTPTAPPPPRMTSVKQTITPREKWDAITRLKYTGQKEGDTWYVISSAWYNRWKNVCAPNKYRADDSDLGPVDNSDIVDEQGNLYPALAESEKYEVLCKEAWDQFVDWYGEPNYTLPRNIISEGEGKAKRVEVYPLKLYVYRMSTLNPAPSNSATPQIVISKAAQIEELLDQVTQISTLDRKDLRFWFVMSTSFEDRPLEGTFYPSDRISLDLAVPFPSEEQKGKRIDDALIEMNDAIVYEYCASGVWTVDMGSLDIAKTTTRTAKPETVKPVFLPGSAEWNAKYGSNTAHSAIKPVSTSARPISIPQSTAIKTHQGSSSTGSGFFMNGRSSAFTGPVRSPGTVGLNNLGNTCFMASALQCLAHCPELTEYFLTGVYQDELNPTNPLGMKGAIAEVFGALLDKLWHPVSYAFAPREFKQQLQRFAPQFSGYAQHDTQEFLAFLLDGLHEDLNRVLKKPFVENPDWNGDGPKELVQHAATSWEGYKKRNDSVIVDLFQGQYKSTLICPECEKVSITFDPFMYLTLPLPVQRIWEHVVHWVPYDVDKQHLKIPVQLSRDASVKDLKLLLKKWMGTPVENQMAVEVFSHKIYKDFEDHSPVAEITDRDLVVFYELPCSSRQTQTGSEDSCFAVPVYHSSSSHTNSYGFHSMDLFGIPLFVAITAEDANSEEAIYTRLVERYAPWTQHPEELYKRRVVIPQSSAASSGTSPSDDAQATDLEEKDVTDMNADADIDLEMLPVSRDPSVTEEETVTNLGPQENLFVIKAYAPSRAGGYSYSAGLLNDPLRGVGETLAERAAPKKKSGWKWSRPSTPEPTAAGAKRPLINSEDTLLCEWDINMLDFFFNITSKGFRRDENSQWEQWETYEHPEFAATKQARKASKERGITLEDCLDEFTKEEKLGEDDLWYCPRCKKHQQATKKFELWKVPDILVVHLKRFSNSRLLRDKIDSFIDFPVEGLDLTNRVEERLVAKKWVEEGKPLEELGTNGISDEPLIYDLFAVDEHLGGLGGGHYRAYAENFEDETWYHFDDTHVTTSKAKESVNPNAYVLFYRRRTNTPLGGATHEKLVAHKERIKSGASLDEQSSEAEPNGAAVASSVKLEPEYTSFAVRSMSPDPSLPEHNEYYDTFGNLGPILPELELELDPANPFASNSPPDFADTLNDTLLESSHDPAYTLGYRRHSASSSNEAVSPASSFGEENRRDLWDDDMENMPELEEADIYQHDYPKPIKDEELDSDNLDHDPSLHTVTAPDPSVSPSLSPTRESAPSPPSGHEEPVPQVKVDASGPVP